MNIVKRELKAGLKPFLFWTLGLFVLIFAGIMKSTGFAAEGGGMVSILDAFPRFVLAMMGMAGVDVGTFGGFYAVLAQYTMILTAVFAVHLGNSAVSREAVDKTYEFVFTKPRTRSFILARKLMAGGTYLTVFCILNFLLSVIAAKQMNLGADMGTRFLLFAAAAWLVGLVFFALGAVFAAVCENSERGAKAGNTAVLAAYAMGVVYDMLENGGVVRVFSPLKYFVAGELLDGRLNPLFIALCVLITAIALWVAFRAFEKRDLKAV